METTKHNRSKYNFGLLDKVGDELFVDPLDVHSMLSSLGSFNRRHGRKIVIEPTGEIIEGKIKCIVTQI